MCLLVQKGEKRNVQPEITQFTDTSTQSFVLRTTQKAKRSERKMLKMYTQCTQHN